MVFLGSGDDLWLLFVYSLPLRQRVNFDFAIVPFATPTDYKIMPNYLTKSQSGNVSNSLAKEGIYVALTDSVHFEKF